MTERVKCLITGCADTTKTSSFRNGLCYTHSQDLVERDSALWDAARSEEREKCLHTGKPWPIADVVNVLAGAARHLMLEHDCDRHGYERVMAAVEAAEVWLLERDSAPAPAEEPKTCKTPPPGWHCTRTLGHDGPCAAIPIKRNEEWWLAHARSEGDTTVGAGWQEPPITDHEFVRGNERNSSEGMLPRDKCHHIVRYLHIGGPGLYCAAPPERHAAAVKEK